MSETQYGLVGRVVGHDTNPVDTRLVHVTILGGYSFGKTTPECLSDGFGRGEARANDAAGGPHHPRAVRVQLLVVVHRVEARAGEEHATRAARAARVAGLHGSRSSQGDARGGCVDRIGARGKRVQEVEVRGVRVVVVVVARAEVVRDGVLVGLETTEEESRGGVPGGGVVRPSGVVAARERGSGARGVPGAVLRVEERLAEGPEAHAVQAVRGGETRAEACRRLPTRVLDRQACVGRGRGGVSVRGAARARRRRGRGHSWARARKDGRWVGLRGSRDRDDARAEISREGRRTGQGLAHAARRRRGLRHGVGASWVWRADSVCPRISNRRRPMT